MKTESKIKILVIVLSVVLVLACGCVPTQSLEDWDKKIANGKIENAGFEADDGYWKLNEFCNICDVPFEGERSLCIGGTDSYKTSADIKISNLKSGYYYLQAYAFNEGNQDYCYIYGLGSQNEAKTSVPRAIENEWQLVTVRGIFVGEDGKLQVGIRSKGFDQKCYVDNLSLVYENIQIPYESAFGGAISWLDWEEDMGAKYYTSDGVEMDALQIMADNGCNVVRLELYNNPGDYVNSYGDTFPRGYKDCDSIFNLAVRANKLNMKIVLSFMYSDYWGNDAIPSDWLALIDAQENYGDKIDILEQKVFEFTKSFMQRLASAGIYPEFVCLGNEMDCGILLPYGSTSSETTILNFKRFMDSGYNAVKEVSPNSRIILHTGCNCNDMFWESKVGTGSWFFGLCQDYGIKYDVIGTSFYPFWAQTNSEYAVKNALSTKDLVEWCNYMIDTFDKDIFIMESGINWGNPGQLANNGYYEGIYKYTKCDQRDFMLELINAIKCVKDGRCLGDLYWDPILVRQEGIGYAVNVGGFVRPNCVETTTFFDYNHYALPVLNAYKYN